ncbi:60s ribosomal protein L14-like protein [Leptotrombidium deliense]|uniref:Large ribosomal subunit protein eL14 n=1 Tax=Leptotrombidium deliense TaxID=299467 RepID=A0A443SFC2_9ACAR|nr:60s ribosomal protein L14-like protein [Leptotrombidium deliense]
MVILFLSNPHSFQQPPKHFIEVGRVAFIHKGPEKGKICTVVDIIDQNRALVDGPESGVKRQPMAFKSLRLTRFKVKIPHGTSSKVISKAWSKDDVNKKFAETDFAKRVAAMEKRKTLTDYERFKVYKLKQRVNKLVKSKFERLRAKAKREAPKPSITPKKTDKKKKKKRVKKDKKK